MTANARSLVLLQFKLAIGTVVVMRERAVDDFNQLIPEMREWNNGAGTDPEGYVCGMGSTELAIGYSLIFWPRFELIDDYVVRGGVSEASIRSWEANGAERRAVEAVLNHLHIADLHHGGTSRTEVQLRYLGRVLKEIYEVKLASDFPARTFIVDFNDEPGLELGDYQLTFWQERD